MQRILPRLSTALCVLALAAIAAADSMMCVQVREGPVRSSPSFMGPVVCTLAYGDRVNVLEKRPGWVKVSTGAASGWMHDSALTTKRIVLSAGSRDAQAAASSDELALAGKGFNKEVEAEYRSGNQNLNYAAVDRMEQRRVSPVEVASFLQDGAVTAVKGGAQ
ncbi:MAG: SH3 domain-containing protein [bacterium]